MRILMKIVLFILLSMFHISCEDTNKEKQRILEGKKIWNLSSCSVYWDFNEEGRADIPSFEYAQDAYAQCDEYDVSVVFTCEDTIDDFCGDFEHEQVSRNYSLVRNIEIKDLDSKCDSPDERLIDAFKCILDKNENFYLLKEIDYDLCTANSLTDCTHGICLSVGGEIIAPYYIPDDSIESKEECFEQSKASSWVTCLQDLLNSKEYFLSNYGFPREEN
jgi:hypothetical protein